jgi:hypothetical protein
MKIDLAKMLVLEMLSIVDEPLNLILTEAKVTEDKFEYIKPDYRNVNISEVDIKKAIKELKSAEMINILDSNGKFLDYDNIDEVLNSKEEWEIWFSITMTGQNTFENNYSDFFELVLMS